MGQYCPSDSLTSHAPYWPRASDCYVPDGADSRPGAKLMVSILGMASLSHPAIGWTGNEIALDPA